MVGKLAADIGMFFEFFSFFYIFFRFDFRKKTRKRTVGLAVCLLLWIAGWLSGLDWGSIGAGPVSLQLVLVNILLYFIFEVTIAEMAVLGTGQWLVLSMWEPIVYIILDYLHMGSYKSEYAVTLWILCCLWVFYFTAGKKMDSQMFRLPVKVWGLLDIILFFLTMMMSFFTYVVAEELPNSGTMVIGRALSAAGGTVICILVFIIIYYYQNTCNFRMQKELAELQNEQQREYFLQLLEKEEETRSFRHEMINDLLELQNYCEKGDYEHMESYLASALGAIKKISKNGYDVGNNILNVILNYYLNPVKEKYCIEVDGYVDEELSVQQRDLCMLSANLVKNAVEAVSRLDEGNIGFHIRQGRDYVCIQMHNTFDGKLELDKKGVPKTSKEDKRNHGIGIHNIKRVVEKYDGSYHAEAAEGVYRVEVYLKL